MRRKKINFYWIRETSSKHSAMHDEAIMWIELSKASKKMKHTSEARFIEKHL